MNTGGGQFGIIEGAERIEVLGIDFCRAIAAQQVVLKENAHLRNNGRTVGVLGSSNLNGSDEVLTCIGTQHSDGKLATGENDRLRKVFQHEAQSRRRERHGVSAVEDDKTVVTLIVVMDDADYFCPQGGFHV